MLKCRFYQQKKKWENTYAVSSTRWSRSYVHKLGLGTLQESYQIMKDASGIAQKAKVQGMF